MFTQVKTVICQEAAPGGWGGKAGTYSCSYHFARCPSVYALLTAEALG